MFALAVDMQGVETTSVSYDLKGLWQGMLTHKDTDYDFFDTIDSGYMQEVGAPRVPQEGVYVAIPENAEVNEVKVVSKTEKELDGEFNILPAPKPVFEGEEEEFIPDKKIYDSDDLFPGKYIDFVGTKHMGGRKVAHILIYLYQYKPKSRKIIALESLELEIIYETKPGMDSTPVRRTPRKSPVDNLILDCESAQQTDAVDSGGADAQKLKDPDNAANYVIITTTDLESSFSIFAAAKSFLYQVKIVTLDEILAEFPNPAHDVAIRDFLIYAAANWHVPPEWVVLGGNINDIPTHMQTDEGATFPSDHYYADLKGDMCPDISVSRFPASTPTDMKKICDTAAYYNRYNSSWRDNVLLTAYERDDYIQCKNDIADTIGSAFTVLKRYAGEASKQQVIDAIDAGVGFINYRGHGMPDSWSASNGLHSSDIPNLTNGDKTPQILSICCLNNDLDNYTEPGWPPYQPPCFGINWIKDEKAITFLGASRPSYTSVNHLFDKYLWDGIINEGLSKAGNIFNWGTTKLYLNNPGQSTKHNIYMYLLLGDPTADYKETLPPTQTKVGFALMLDTSGSMSSALPMVKIDAQAFVREARPGDQFGVNQFNSIASWVYPTGSSPDIVTVSQDLSETKAAAQAIENISSTGITNLGQAIQLGNNLISQATTDVQAFVILSDGLWNTGPDPAAVLGNQPPIFVAGLGPYLSQQMFTPLLAKNPNSQFYHKPDPYQMMQVFNDIRALPHDVGLASNSMNTYSGSDYTITESMISKDSEEAQFSVVWSDKRYQYTSGTPGGYNINVLLIDPDGNTTSDKPVITAGGYCIFNLTNVKPGLWKTLVQYSVPQPAFGTVGGFQFNTQVNLFVDAPTLHTAGKPLYITASVLDEGMPVEGLNIHAYITKPKISVQQAVTKYRKLLKTVEPDKRFMEKGMHEEIARLDSLRKSKMKQKDILPYTQSHGTMKPKSDGSYQYLYRGTKIPGPYSVVIQVTGKNHKTGKSFSRTKCFGILVG
jgi:hypothetical protein